jgi:hypothetical protein
MVICTGYYRCVDGLYKTPGSKLDYELAISEGNKNFAGYSLIIYPKDGIENIGIKTAKIQDKAKKKYILKMGNWCMIISHTPPIRM